MLVHTPSSLTRALCVSAPSRLAERCSLQTTVWERRREPLLVHPSPSSSLSEPLKGARSSWRLSEP